MKIVWHLFCLAVMILSLLQCTMTDQKNGHEIDIQKDGLVPNEETAKRLAEVIWNSIYGKSVEKEKPYTATLIGDSLWIVEGTSAKESFGGVAHIEIRKSDCKILKVFHGK